MVRFFVNRPVVAIVIAILITLVGLVSLARLPVAQYPNIVPPEIWVIANYVGADALTVEQSVATPIEEQMNGVDNMEYMYSVNPNDGRMILHVVFDVNTDPNTDLILAQIRESQAESQIPADVRNFGITVTKSYLTPMMVLTLSSPRGTRDPKFLANYAFINLNDPLLRVPGVGQVAIFGAGQYAMRLWVDPDTLAKLDITVSEIISAIEQQNTVNPAGQIGGEPVPPGQQFTYAVRAQGRLTTPEEFGNIVVRAKPDGSTVRVRDVARVDLGAQAYSVIGNFNGKPSAIIALYQLPGTNAIDAADGVRAMMEQAKKRFPADLEYAVSLDTTLAVREGIKEIFITMLVAITLVLLVVFLFLQNFRATIIPMLAVPVSLIGTFIFFPILGFSVNTLSLLGLVLAVGLVVDDAIIVVESVERHIEEGEPPKEATINAMREVQGPVVAVALVLASVFIPTVFIPGITGRLYTQFAITIAISVLISAFNALSLSPALAAMLLKPRKPARGPLARFFAWFNRTFKRATEGYVNLSGALIRKALVGIGILVSLAFLAFLVGKGLPRGFVPEEDQGYFFVNVQLPNASSLQRTEAVCLKVDEMMRRIPAVEFTTTAAGFSMLSTVRNTYSGFVWVALKPWSQRGRAEDKVDAIMRRVNRELAHLPEARAFAFAPPAIPGIGSAGGVIFVLEDRVGKEISFLTENTQKFLAAVRRRPEIASASTTLLADVPQVYADVNRDKTIMQGVDLGEVYRTLQSFMGGVLINYAGADVREPALWSHSGDSGPGAPYRAERKPDQHPAGTKPGEYQAGQTPVGAKSQGDRPPRAPFRLAGAPSGYPVRRAATGGGQCPGGRGQGPAFPPDQPHRQRRLGKQGLVSSLFRSRQLLGYRFGPDSADLPGRQHPGRPAAAGSPERSGGPQLQEDRAAGLPGRLQRPGGRSQNSRRPGGGGKTTGRPGATDRTGHPALFRGGDELPGGAGFRPAVVYGGTDAGPGPDQRIFGRHRPVPGPGRRLAMRFAGGVGAPKVTKNVEQPPPAVLLQARAPAPHFGCFVKLITGFKALPIRGGGSRRLQPAPAPAFQPVPPL